MAKAKFVSPLPDCIKASLVSQSISVPAIVASKREIDSRSDVDKETETVVWKAGTAKKAEGGATKRAMQLTHSLPMREGMGEDEQAEVMAMRWTLRLYGWASKLQAAFDGLGFPVLAEWPVEAFPAGMIAGLKKHFPHEVK